MTDGPLHVGRWPLRLWSDRLFHSFSFIFRARRITFPSLSLIESHLLFLVLSMFFFFIWKRKEHSCIILGGFVHPKASFPFRAGTVSGCWVPLRNATPSPGSGACVSTAMANPSLESFILDDEREELSVSPLPEPPIASERPNHK